MSPRPPQLDIAAYHEAGHVVMGFLVQSPFPERVWVTEEGDGKVETRDLWPVDLDLLKQGVYTEDMIEKVQRMLKGRVKSFLAGPIAEYKFLRKRITGPLDYQNISVEEEGESDLQKVWRIIRGLTHARRREVQETHIINEVHQLIIQEEVKEIFRKPKVWPAITTLASALIKHKELDGDTAWKICEECGLTYGREVST